MIANADAKYKSQFYFLKGQALAGKKRLSKLRLNHFQDLKAFEKNSGKEKIFRKEAPMLNSMIGEVSKKELDLYNAKDYKNATKDFYITFLIESKRYRFFI